MPSGPSYDELHRRVPHFNKLCAVIEVSGNLELPISVVQVLFSKTTRAWPRFGAAKFVSFSCSFIKKIVGPLRAVEVGPRRAPKQAVGRGFTSVEADESDWAGTSKMPSALPMVAIDSRTTRTPNKPRSPTCRIRPVPQFDRTVFHGTAVNA